MAVDRLFMGDGVALQLEQIEPWADQQKQEMLNQHISAVHDIIQHQGLPFIPRTVCHHTVKTDVTSQYGLITTPQILNAGEAFQTEPMPKGTMVLQCVECKELFIEAE